jgi:RNA polymerase sigma-70 factor (ECF subfamily)
MSLVSNQRAVWLARHVLPVEPALRAWLARRPHGRAQGRLEIDDVVQETYAILAALPEVEHIQDVRSYTFQVAKTVILRALRRSQVVAFEALAEADSLEAPDPQPLPETVLADRQELGRAAALIAALPGKCREAFTLRKVHGLSQREVARQMGISENTVEKHVGKAIAVLMRAMGRGGKRRLAASREGDERQQDPAGRARARQRD